ncbi:MAG: signal peptide peptidase SppA [Alistipes sp.]|nr:signal peptide peptidase SppA [Alistipes sp.]
MKFLKMFLAGLLAFFVGGAVVTFFGVAILLGVIGSLSSQTPAAIGSHAILKIDFSEDLVEAPSGNPFDSFDFATMTSTPRVTLYDALRAIGAAKEDPRIEGIYIRPEGSGGGFSAAVLEELREAVEDFRRSGKFVVAYNETFSQGEYYLASAADKIYMEPHGGMEWSGLSSTLMFFKGLFDKLDIEAEIFRPTACRYKSAVEPYFLAGMSEENRRQMQRLADSQWGVIVGAVAASRGIEVAELNRLADRLEVSLASEALEHRLIDGLLFEDQMDEVFRQYGATPDEEGGFSFVKLGEYASQLTVDVRNISSPAVAVVYADGAIVDGRGTGKDIYGNTLAATLADVRRDDDVAAVVLRVNSPGGSALASDVIWREMELLREQKPVIVSMGGYAASGGYYISCGADAILADRTTLTGSIGVFGMFLRMEDALRNKLGITFDAVRTNTSSDMGVMRPLTRSERAAIMRGVDEVYDTFTANVAEGRNLPLDQVLEIAGGRVWSGEDAVRIGLADANGGLRAALSVAAEKAGLGDGFRVVERVEAPSGVAALFSGFAARVKADMVADELGPWAAEWSRLRQAVGQQGIVMYCPCETAFE